MGIRFDAFGATSDDLRAYLEERLTRAFDAHGDGFLLLGGQENPALWDSATQAFISRNWIGAVLASQAMCERTLAARYELQDLPGAVDYGRKDVGRKALGVLIRWTREDRLVDPGTLDKIQILCDRRRALTHLLSPMDPDSMSSRIRELIRSHPEQFEDAQERLMAEDALVAVDAVLALCFGDFSSVSGASGAPA